MFCIKSYSSVAKIKIPTLVHKCQQASAVQDTPERQLGRPSNGREANIKSNLNKTEQDVTDGIYLSQDQPRTLVNTAIILWFQKMWKSDSLVEEIVRSEKKICSNKLVT